MLHMSFKLALIALVYPNAASEANLDVSLLQKANAWLQRLAANKADDLFLIGVGFADEPSFLAKLKPYGLAFAKISVISPVELEDAIGSGLGEAVEPIAANWILNNHKSAIPLAKWDALLPDASYPVDGWWWVGLEAKGDDQSSFADILEELLPDAFKDQALTWATLFAEYYGSSAGGEEHEIHEAAMKTVALARWLVGFDAATGNNFYDFSASDAIRAAGLDELRLGFEAGRNHESELLDYFEGNDSSDEGLAGACLLACLDERMGEVRTALSDAFGGDSLLFWSLYRSIWSDLKTTGIENMDDLLSLRLDDEGELDRPWRFVTDGWIDFAEE